MDIDISLREADAENNLLLLSWYRLFLAVSSGNFQRKIVVWKFTKKNCRKFSKKKFFNVKRVSSERCPYAHPYTPSLFLTQSVNLFSTKYHETQATPIHKGMTTKSESKTPITVNSSILYTNLLNPCTMKVWVRYKE